MDSTLLASKRSSASSSSTGLQAEPQSHLLTRMPVLRHTVSSKAKSIWIATKDARKHRLVKIWALATVSASIIVGCLLLIVNSAIPKKSIALSTQNFISNNPLHITNPDDGVSQWLNDYSHSTLPVSCHSHNDYIRPHPVFSALVAGCTSIEADVWLGGDGDLLVGHKRRSLSKEKTLKSLYIDPLLECLRSLNDEAGWKDANSTDALPSSSSQAPDGLFRTRPDQTVILHIDVKDDAKTTWPVVLKQLEPLRRLGLLSFSEGTGSVPGMDSNFTTRPVTVVATGNMMKHRDAMIGSDIKAWVSHHDTFLDAPLDMLDQHGDANSSELNWNRAEFYTASVSLSKAVGSVIGGFSKSQLATLHSHIEAARRLNLTSRYWDLPHWPVSRRDYVWDILAEEGIGLLNADDVQSAARRQWRNWAYELEVKWMWATSASLGAGVLFVGWLCYRTHKN